MQTVLHFPPLLQMSGSCPKKNNNIEISKYFQNRNKPRNRGKAIWDNVQTVCWPDCVFLDFSRFLSVLDKSVDFSIFFDFGLFLSNSRCLCLSLFLSFFFRFWTPSFDFSMFLTYKASPAGSSQDKTICSKTFNTGQLCKEEAHELRRFSITKQQEN